jgi:hypothetical protein
MAIADCAATGNAIVVASSSAPPAVPKHLIVFMVASLEGSEVLANLRRIDLKTRWSRVRFHWR